MATFHVSYCILCDDVRTEVGGKEIIIGVYPVGISLPMLPWAALGCIRLGVIWSGDGTLNFRLRVLNPVQVTVGDVASTGHAIWQGITSAITVQGLLMNFEMEGYYDIQISKEDGPWESIYRFPVYLIRANAS